MLNYGFAKVAAAIPEVKVSNCKWNVTEIINQIQEAENKGVEVITFPELSITGYTCADLFFQQLLLEEAEMSLIRILSETRQYNIISIVGAPISLNGQLLNTAIVIQKGKVLGIVPKTYLPNYKEFYEKRWFTSGKDISANEINYAGQKVPLSTQLIFRNNRFSFGIEICEDLWSPIPPSSYLSLKGADIIFNLSADNESIDKHNYLCSLISQQSARCIGGYVFSSCGLGESTTDVVFAGNGLIYESGKLLAKHERFSNDPQLVIGEIDIDRLRNERRTNTTFSSNISTIDYPCTYIATEANNEKVFENNRTFTPTPFVPSGSKLDERCEEIFNIQVAGLAQRIKHTHCKTSVVGISGGLDSTLALLVCVRTYDKLGLPRKDILGITMPGFGTTDRTYNNAIQLMQSLGITIREISIKDACIQHFKDINHDINVHDVTYENGQARERTQILMDIANQTNGMVIGTGDLSELALGWATYNGDHMSMYAVNTSIPKTLVKHLVNWVANQDSLDEVSRTTLLDIVDTPISPELIPANENGEIKQKTEDLVGPYELHDFFLYHFMRNCFRPSKIYFLAQKAFGEKYKDETIKKWLYTFFRRFFAQQFKRSCLPDGPKVGSVSISPRGDWRMPSDASSQSWLDEINNL